MQLVEKIAELEKWKTEDQLALDCLSSGIVRWGDSIFKYPTFGFPHAVKMYMIRYYQDRIASWDKNIEITKRELEGSLERKKSRNKKFSTYLKSLFSKD